MWSVQLPILRHGTAQQHATYLPRLSSGEWIGAHAMSEPDAGSDAFALRTRATGGSAGYVLNGVKSFVSQAPLADVFVVFATTEPDAGAMGITAFLVERSAPGLHVGPPLDKLGLRTSPMAMLHLTDCAVPASNVLGRVGRGASVFLEAMEWERAAIMASAVGTMQRVVDEAARMVRRAGVHSGSSQRVVDMRVRLECSRLALYRAVWAKCRSEVAPELPSIAKLVISDAFVRNTQDALSVRAACGDVGGEDWERMLRDAIGGLLYSGTNEIQRRIIARSMSLPVD
jgi:alkylation response protein AidB-like acyl-CoA dehydrogenase